ncbi:MAG: hypothetical protein IT537_22565 [Hyphomicrobiales bacterium]|nr:hypothetical protein [Hyphomicrobiales bacterium]
MARRHRFGSRLKHLGTATGLIAASILSCLLMLEIGLRLVNGQPVWPDRNFIMERARANNLARMGEYDSQLGWAHRANNTVPERLFSTGELGIRMNQWATRPLTRHATLVVGSSFAAGAQVANWESWPAYLEGILGTPVLNGGVGGWAFDQTVLQSERLLPLLSPSTLILGVVDKDIIRSSYRVLGAANKPYFLVENSELVPRNQPVPRNDPSDFEGMGPARTLLGRSYLVDFVMARLGATDWYEFRRNIRDPQVDGAEVSCLLLRRLKATTDDRGVRLMLVMQWGGSDIVQTPYRPQYAARVLDCANDLGIQAIDTWAVLKAALEHGQERLEALYVMLANGTLFSHMSPEGNRLVAELVARGLADEKFTGRRDEPPTGSRAHLPTKAVFDQEAKLQELVVVPSPEVAVDGRAMLLQDRSSDYGAIFQDFPVADDRSAHTFSIDLKAADSPIAQILMIYHGGEQKTYHAFVDLRHMSTFGSGDVERTKLPNGWYRIKLTGANNHAGNTIVRLQVYPRHGKPQDVGSVHVANALLDP